MRRITVVERKESLPLIRVISQGEIWEWYCLVGGDEERELWGSRNKEVGFHYSPDTTVERS